MYTPLKGNKSILEYVGIRKIINRIRYMRKIYFAIVYINIKELRDFSKIFSCIPLLVHLLSF